MSKLIIVSGGTQGIGKAVIEKFAQCGFDVITCARKEKNLTAIKVKLETAYPVRVYCRAIDMSIKQQVDDFSQYIIAQNRSIDVLVHNVGCFMPGGITETSVDILEKMMDTNLYSAYHLTRGMIHNMKKNKKGHIFLICSVASLMSYPNGGAYSVSKFAMFGLAKALRQELMPFDIRVTAVLPGATLTDSWEGSTLPQQRFIKPEDVAESVYSAYSLSHQSVVEELIIRPQLGDI